MPKCACNSEFRTQKLLDNHLKWSPRCRQIKRIKKETGENVNRHEQVRLSDSGEIAGVL